MGWLSGWTYRKAQTITAHGSIAGTIAVTNGSNAVVGTNTLFLEWGVGCQIKLPDNNWYTIGTITNNTHLTISVNYPGSNLSGQTYDMRLINYQVQLLVGESAGATGEEVDCNSHVQTDFDDLRFTNSDGETLLDYWIESITGTTPNQLATIWIEFDIIGTSATTFYMYYGNAGATSVSNMANTFITNESDDFERGVDGDTIGGNWIEDVAHVHISTDHAYGGTRCAKLVGAATNPYAHLPATMSIGVSVRFRVLKENAGTMYVFWGQGTSRVYIYSGTDEKLYYNDGTSHYTGVSLTADAWQLIELNHFRFDISAYDIWLNGTKIIQAAMQYNATTPGFTIYTTGTTGNDCYFDDVIIRNWVLYGTAWGSWGSEEESPPPPGTSFVSWIN